MLTVDDVTGADRARWAETVRLSNGQYACEDCASAGTYASPPCAQHSPASTDGDAR